MDSKFTEYIESILRLEYGKTVENAERTELYNAIGKAYNSYSDDISCSDGEKRAAYFSAEFLIGKLTVSNLFNSGVLEETEDFLNKFGRSLGEFEDFDDPALGNGGLGRLAACFLDSAASVNIPLDGYGIRYSYGYFKQLIVDNKQKEVADNWLKFTDSFGRRKDDLSVEVLFGNEKVKAVPYLYYIPGFRNNRINRLFLFKAEPINSFDYESFDRGEYAEAFSECNSAAAITATLYPNDNTDNGKELRLKQQYFFTSAALQLIINEHIKSGKSIELLAESISIQLNDTHPVIAIPEFIRLITNFGYDFIFAFKLAEKIFSYTNHTVLAEALEKWDEKLFLSVIPNIYEIVRLIDDKLKNDLKMRKISDSDCHIINDGKIYMANLACYVCKSINGVAKIHSEIIKTDTLKSWYRLYPQKFNNKTNGVTQRRWLALANPELYKLLKEKCGEDCLTQFSNIKRFEEYSNNLDVLDTFIKIRNDNKKALCNYILKNEGVEINPDFVFCVQIKRLHEYKRQLMNILSIIYIYLSLKYDAVSDFTPTVFIIGAKSAPGYEAAKRIIEFINIVSGKINEDTDTNDKLKVVFVSNYNVSYAEKIIPAADISEQISLAGKEASGTSNMKFMMNGALTLGTYDGANIEIVEKAGEENNFIFGLREDEVRKLNKSYDPLEEYQKNPMIQRVVDTLIDDTFLNEGDDPFEDIYTSIVNDDKYMVLKDLSSYIERKLEAIKCCSDKYSMASKAICNIANSYDFSSDRTVKEYAKEIWFN